MSHTAEIDIIAFWKIALGDLNFYHCLNRAAIMEEKSYYDTNCTLSAQIVKS